MRPRAVQADDATEEDRPERATDPGVRKKAAGYRSMGRAMPLRFAVVLLSMAYSIGAPFAGTDPAVVVSVISMAGVFIVGDSYRPGGLVKAE